MIDNLTRLRVFLNDLSATRFYINTTENDFFDRVDIRTVSAGNKRYVLKFCTMMYCDQVLGYSGLLDVVTKTRDSVDMLSCQVYKGHARMNKCIHFL